MICVLSFCYAAAAQADEHGGLEAIVGKHMIAQAMLTAHYVAAAKKAGMSAEEINAALAEIADKTVIDEFWVSNETGELDYSSVPAPGFAFTTDPDADVQTAPFARLLSGEAEVVEQGVEARVLDGKRFKYVGVAGVDTARIVQVGMQASAFE